MMLFGKLGQTGLNDAAVLAKGIALILNATLIGLLIAIPSLVFWSYFSKKVEVFAVEMEALCDEFIRRQYSASIAAAANAEPMSSPPPRPRSPIHGTPAMEP